jgi:hypothetical protein
LKIQSVTLKKKDMLLIHPQYIKDADGNKSLVVLPAKEFDTMMEELEELEDIRLYDDAKKNDTGERVPMDETFRMIEANRENIK